MGYAGSNPAPATMRGPHSSVVEHALGKGEVAGSNPAVGSNFGR